MQFALPNNRAGSRGDLGILINGRPAPLGWKIRNALQTTFIRGSLAVLAAKAFSRLTSIPTITSELHVIRTSADGQKTDYGVVSRRVVTDVGADAIALAFTGTSIASFDYHGVGTGTTSEAAGDTALVTESTTVLAVNSVRATGTPSNPASKQYRSVGTITFDGTAAITEHGLFNDADVSEGDLFDRSVFLAVNVISGDSVQLTYTVSINSGG